MSDAHARAATLPEMAQALWSELDGSWALVGASMGGMLALEMQRLEPRRVHSLALLGTSARPDTPELVQLRSDAIVRFQRGEAGDVLRENVALAFHPSRRDDKALVARYIALVLRGGVANLIAQNRAVMARRDFRPLLRDIATPTLVACGDNDMLAPLVMSQELADGIRGARLEVIAQCGHMLTMEQPDAVNALLLSWLGTER